MRTIYIVWSITYYESYNYCLKLLELEFNFNPIILLSGIISGNL